MIDDYLNKILFHVDDDQDLGQEVVKEDQAGSSNAVDSDMTKKYRSEIDEAKAYFLRNVRPSTVAAYMPCVEAWMVKLKY
jgi:hypothetical protein